MILRMTIIRLLFGKNKKVSYMHVLSCLKTSLCEIIIATALSVTLAGPAFAVDSDALVSRIQDVLQQNSLALNYTGIDADGGRVTLHNVSITTAKEADNAGPAIVLGDVVFNQVEEGMDGSYMIRQVTAGNTSPDGGNSRSGGQLVAEGLEASDVYLGPKGTSEPLSRHLPYSHIIIKKIALAYKGKTFATLDNSASSYSKDASDGLIQNASSIESFAFDPSAVPGESGQTMQKTLADLGYDKVEGALGITSSWDPVKGGLDISRSQISVKDGGSLEISVKLNGVTEDLLDELKKVYTRMSRSKRDEQVGALALLGLAQQSGVNTMTIRYDDNSLAGRVIDFASKTNNQSREQTVSQLKAVLPLLAIQLQNPQFADKAVKETSAFLDHPKSLEISAKPEKPVTFAMIVTAAATLPQKLIDILSVTITANQP